MDAVSGGAGDDTISGLLGSSGTYTVGDNIAGGSGTDTLNLIAVTGTDADGGLISVNGVESINIRVLATAYGSAGDQVSMNAADWVGVTTLSNASSLANTQLDVSGLTDDTTILLYGNTDINIDYNNTVTGATANAVLVNAGSAGTATTIGSASGTNTANFDFDKSGAGLITSVNLDVRGSLNLARIDADGSAMTYTITGTGNAALISNDLISTFDASAAAGNIDMTFEGSSNVSAKGGAGNDIFRFGTTYTDSDSVIGGAGNNTITLSVSVFEKALKATDVQTAEVTFTDAESVGLNASSATATTTFNLLAASSDADAVLNNIIGDATINVLSDTLDDVTVDTSATGGSLTLNIGSSTSYAAVDDVTVTDYGTITVNSIGSGANSIGDLILDTDATNVTIIAGGTADLTVGTAKASGATSVSLRASGSASLSMTSADFMMTGLTTLTINAEGGNGADIDLVGALFSGTSGGSKLDLISIVAASGADIGVDKLNVGNNAYTASGAPNSLDISVIAGANSWIGDAITAGSGIDVAATGANVNLILNAQQSGSITFEAIAGGHDIGSAGTSLSTISVSASIATAGLIEIESIAAVSADSLVVSLGSVNIAQSGDLSFGSAGISLAGRAFSFGDINVGASASATFGEVDASAISAITISVATGGQATLGQLSMTGSGVIGNISLAVNASGANVTLGQIGSAGSSISAIGAITITTIESGSVDVGAIIANAGDVGAITINNSEDGDVDFSTISASSIASITVSGGGVVDFGAIGATNLTNGVSATQMSSGTFTIDLSGVTNRVVVNLGAADNTIITGNGNDIVTLLAGRTAYAGNDVITYAATGKGLDNVVNFIAGAAASGGDQIELSIAMTTAGLINADGEAIAADDDSDLSVALFNTATALDALDNIIVIGTALASTAAMLDFIDGVSLATAAQASSSFVIAWGDGTNTYVSVVDALDTGSAAATTLASAGHTLTVSTLVQISGVTPGALVAANFDFIA